MRRRDFVAGLALPLSGAPLDLKSAAARVRGEETDRVEVSRRWSGNVCRTSIKNRGRGPAAVREVVLFELPLSLPPETPLYGESFQMLSQTGGTLARPVDFGYSERKHYRIPGPDDATVVTGLLALGNEHVLAFTSSKRFVGRFYVRPRSIEVVVDTEQLTLAPGESWELEEFVSLTGATRAAMLDEVAARIARNHPPLKFPSPPTGWCSWYCFGPRVTAQQVLDNLDKIARDVPGLKYVQIDDGYQPAMGDWLDTGNAFGGDVRRVLTEIRKRGFEPAIWVAPFIAEAGSKLFQEHPDWFVRGTDGAPLPSSFVTFGGWRRGPWYALDGTHIGVQKHFESLFRTMRQDWGCTYFKLDANFWGAMHGGRFADQKATRVQAYRRGMEAILRGAGDSFILGCNHPIWPSFGLIHGSRSSDDIKREWARFKRVARQNLSRNWQNGRLWWNDPDAVVFSGDLPIDEYRFHGTMAFASGGMILSGDDLTTLPPDRMQMLRKLLPVTGRAARFEDETLRVGRVDLPGGRVALCLFNWEDTPSALNAAFKGPMQDLWTGETFDAGSAVPMKPRSGRVLTAV